MKVSKSLVCLWLLSAIFVLNSPSQEVNSIPSAPVVDSGLVILQKDIVVQQQLGPYGDRIGVDLYIRKKEKIQSVLLVETTKDPAGKQANYAYRAQSWNKINGDEIRYLDGKELHSEYSKYSLISSTVVKHETLGECFHIYIPMTLVYGYPWSRNGTVNIDKGTFINVRSFSKKYGDYSGEFQDNPFMFDFTKISVPKPAVETKIEDEVIMTDDYNSVAAQKFEEIAKESNGAIIYSKGPETLSDDLVQAVARITPKDKADIVFAIDTTGSMKDDMDCLRNEWVPRLIKQLESFKDVRIGLLFYRDWTDSYSFKGLPVKYFDWTRYPEQFVKCLNTAVIRGNEGGDVPEAVYEAIFACCQHYEWRKDASKKIILIGDAEPHPFPRGPKKITKDYVTGLAREKEIILDCIIVPDDKSYSRSR